MFLISTTGNSLLVIYVTKTLIVYITMEKVSRGKCDKRGALARVTPGLWETPFGKAQTFSLDRPELSG